MPHHIVFEQVIRESQKQQIVQELFEAGILAFVEAEYQHSEGEKFSPDTSSFDPLIIVACVVSTTYVARQINALWRDAKEPGGEVIDARNGKLRRFHVPSLDRGTLVILTDDGRAVYRPDENSAATVALNAVLSKLER